jgi:hypothetical protein
MYSARTGQARLGYRPSKKSIKRMVEKLHAMTVRSMTWQETTELVGKLNRTLRGWANYFQVGTVSKAYRALDNYTAMRLRRWLRLKHKVRRRKGGAYPLSHLYGYFGLVRLSRLGHDVAWRDKQDENACVWPRLRMFPRRSYSAMTRSIRASSAVGKSAADSETETVATAQKY